MYIQNAIYVEQSNPFMNIESDFQEQIELLREKQNKLLNDDDNDNYLMEYLRCEGPFIKIADEFRCGMQIFIKTIDNKMFTFEMKHSSKIRDVKLKIQEKTKFFVDQQNLFFQGEILNNDKTIEYYEICEKSVIDIVVGLRGGMRIFAKTMEGKTVTFEVYESERITDVKKKVQEKTGFHPDEQKLVYKYGILENDKTVGQYQITDKSVINVVERFRPDGMLIFVKIIDGLIVPFEVLKSDKIIDIKRNIQGFFPDEQKLVCQGDILNDDNKTIDEYQICDKSVIDIVDKLRDGIIISVRKTDGKTVAFEVLKSDKIIDIKKKIQDETGLNPDEQILVYRDEILDDDNKTIDEYQICEKYVINIVARLRNKIQIFIKISHKSIVPIRIVKNSKISDVKSKFKQKTGMQFVVNNLIYENKILDNDKLLIDYHIDDGCVISIDTDSQLLLFLEAIKSGSLERVQDLYDDKLNEMDRELSSTSPMHYACKQRNTDIVKFLIENKFKINSFDKKLNKPIHYVCINGCVEILETLIKHQCNLDVCDAYGMKPIHLACLHGNLQNAKLLIENHCDLESQDYLERRPIHLACLIGNIDIVQLLIQNKCQIDVLDKLNKSPFNIVEKENRVDIIKILNEEISNKMMVNMIEELNLKCDNNCDHKFCRTSLLKKTFNTGVRIGRGGYGEVYQCKLSQSSHQIAIKQILISESDSKTIEGNINKFINKINHERIIKYFGAITKDENIFIFMEFMTGGSLRSHISTNPQTISSKVIHYTIQILEGLQFLHDNKIIHRDIKPDNILLDNDGNVKLTDLGLGLLLCTTDGRTTQANTFCGTMYYMAPEIINGDPYSYSADIWSLGVTVIEMATGKRPYSDLLVPQAVMFKIATTKTIPYQLGGSSSNYKLKLVIDQMINPEPSKRPSATQLINNFINLQ